MSSLPHRRVDVMAGSERMLKAHHKNAMSFKSLENQKVAYDLHCDKNLGKIQQDIYEVYFNEYLPLKEEASKTQQRLPRLSYSPSPRVTDDMIPGRGRKLILPEITSRSSVNQMTSTSLVTDTDSYLEKLREKVAARKHQERKLSRSVGRSLNLTSKEEKEMRNEFRNQSQCSAWKDSLSESSDSPPIDEKRLQILKTAISLTSQPVKQPEPRKPRRHRRSLFVQARKQSKQMRENELIRRVSGEIHENIDEPGINSGQRESMIWQPSLYKNKIFNEEEEEENDMVFHFVDRVSRASMASVKSEVSRVSLRRDIPFHDIEEDLYHSESSPDLFSVISEHTGSSYSGSSYSTGSGSSCYSFETEDEFT